MAPVQIERAMETSIPHAPGMSCRAHEVLPADTPARDQRVRDPIARHRGRAGRVPDRAGHGDVSVAAARHRHRGGDRRRGHALGRRVFALSASQDDGARAAGSRPGGAPARSLRRSRRARRLRHVLVLALAELLDRLRAEGGDVVGLAARHEALVDVDLLVDPGAAGVADVGRKRRPRPDRAAPHDARLDEDPRPVADRRDRLVGLGEGGRELDGVLVGPQEVAVRDAARDEQAVVVVDAHVGDRLVDRELVAVVEVVEGLDLAGVEADELGARAGLLERLARLGQLDLLDAVGGEDRDLLAVQLAHVGSFPFGCSSAWATDGRGARNGRGWPVCGRFARARGRVGRPGTEQNRSKENRMATVRSAAQGILADENTETRERIVEMLKKAYWMEIETVMSYIANSINPDGVRAQEIVESLQQDITEELGHAQQFAQRIKELYGVVPGSLEFHAEQSYLQPPDEQTDIVHVIKGVIEAETGAIEHYNALIEATDETDPVTNDMVIAILRDEEGHRRLFEGYLREYEAEGRA